MTFSKVIDTIFVIILCEKMHFMRYNEKGNDGMKKIMIED